MPLETSPGSAERVGRVTSTMLDARWLGMSITVSLNFLEGTLLIFLASRGFGTYQDKTFCDRVWDHVKPGGKE